MKMKTLTQVNPKAVYTFDPNEIGLKRSNIQSRIARAISIWTGVEHLTATVLLHSLGADPRIASEMFLSITSSSASNAALKTATKLGLKPEYAELFNALWILNGDLAQERHKLAHWLLGFSKDVPDALLLFNPKDGFRRGAHNLACWHLGQHRDFLTRPTGKIRVASREYLDALIFEFLAQLDRIHVFIDLLRLDVTADAPPSEIQRLFERLHSDPCIRQTIVLARNPQRKSKKVSRPRPKGCDFRTR